MNAYFRKVSGLTIKQAERRARTLAYSSEVSVRSKPVRGFTLIELLVVIAIIGVLSSVVLASLNAARAKANDSRRLSDMMQVRTALELFYDTNGRYPIQSTWRGTTPGCYGTGSDPNTAIPGLVPTYIPVMPQDPKWIPSSYCYLYMSDGTNYKFMVFGTVESGNLAPGTPNARYPLGCGSAQNSYAIYTPAWACN